MIKRKRLICKNNKYIDQLGVECTLIDVEIDSVYHVRVTEQSNQQTRFNVNGSVFFIDDEEPVHNLYNFFYTEAEERNLKFKKIKATF